MVNATVVYDSLLGDQLSNMNIVERTWERYYNWFDNDILATGVLLLVVHELVYFGRSLPWMILDSMPSMRKYKIQDKRPPTKAQYLECLKSVLISHIFVEAVPIFGFHYICEYFNISYRAPLPSLWTISWQMAVLLLVEDTWHYWGHRALHWPWLYKNVHKQHHKYAAPFGLTAEYAHPAEVAFTGVGTVGSPLLLAYFTGNMHLLTVMLWITVRLFQAIDSHSGYEFPISLHHFLPIWAGADHHDDHHHYFVGNYASSFRHWDYFLNTETAATSRRRDVPTGKDTTHRNDFCEDPDDVLEKQKSAAAAASSALKAEPTRAVKASGTAH